MFSNVSKSVCRVAILALLALAPIALVAQVAPSAYNKMSASNLASK